MHFTRAGALSIRTWFGCWLFACLAVSTYAAQPPTDTASAASATSGPPRVDVGIYLHQIDSLSLKDSQVSVDFHIWFRWTGDAINPIETFDVVNGKVDSKEDITTSTVNGQKYACCRVLATIHKLWDVRQFPLDEHTVQISIEDEFEDFKQRYVADVENSGVDPEAELAGWTLTPVGAKVVTHAYRTNYGDLSLPTGHASDYSRFIYAVSITRPGYGVFIKLFAGLFIAAAISFHALLIRPTELDARFGLAVGAMFAAVASEYVVVSTLPDSNYLTLADKLHIMTFAFVFLSLAVSVISGKMAAHGREKMSLWFDRFAFVTLMSAYTIAVAYEVMAR
jgi:hypothetical protein